MTQSTTAHSHGGKSLPVAYFLWLFLGAFGAHRLYAGRTGSAIGMIALYWGAFLLVFTVIGLVLAIPMWIAFGIWWVVDAIRMPGWDSLANS